MDNIIIPETGRNQMIWPKHCVQGTDGSEYHPSLQLAHTDTEVLKGQLKLVESYSAFGGDGEVTGLK